MITIDGPAGSGKTTLGRRLATTLGLPLVDTGLFYRGVMVAAARAGIGPDDRDALIDCARRTEVVIDTDPSHDGAARVDGIEAGPALRDPANAPLLASMSSIPEVRSVLLERSVRSRATGPSRSVATAAPSSSRTRSSSCISTLRKTCGRSAEPRNCAAVALRPTAR